MKGGFADEAGRTAFIDGLRELAAYLEANPQVPAPAYSVRIQLDTTGTDEEQDETVREAAQVMGVEPQHNRSHFSATREFGPIKYYVLAIPQADMEAYHAIQELGKQALEERHAEAVTV